MKANVPGGRFWEPTEETTMTEQEWKQFEEWVAENEGIEPDPELPFN